MGPGRKFYHKPCLACMTCKKRLDSFSLLEHDQEPYCKSCHAKNFGTHNPGHRSDSLLTPPRKRPTVDVDGESSLAGSPSTAPYSPDGPPRTAQLSPTRVSGEGDVAEPNEVSEPEPAPDLNASRAKAPIAERYAAAAAVQRRHMTGDGVESPPRPIPRTLTGGSPSPRRYGGDNPACARCSKVVYFAEQVKAVGKIYHKGCLRCTECNTLLDSNRLRDHDGEPLCASCHGKLHGPQGLKK